MGVVYVPGAVWEKLGPIFMYKQYEGETQQSQHTGFTHGNQRCKCSRISSIVWNMVLAPALV